MLADGLTLAPAERQRLVAIARSSGQPREPAAAEDATPPAPWVGVPPDPVAHFVGREVELGELHELLRRHGRAAVDGLAGVGKTQLVARHLYLRRADYPDGAFWLRADQETSLVGDLGGLAWRLRLPERRERRQERQVEAVLRWLRKRRRWLLVLDNLEPVVQDSVQHWLPPGLPGHVLLTSRAPVGPTRLHLGPLPVATAASFLLSRTSQVDGEAAVAVSERLGGLPLALEQAAAYVDVSGRDLAGYGELLETRLLDLMSVGQPTGYPRPIASTWRLSFERIETERPDAAALLRLCAFLAPDDVPVSVLVGGWVELPDELGRAVADPLELDGAVAALRRYSLIERRAEALHVHRLVQAVVRESLPAAEAETWLASAVRLLFSQFPERSDRRLERWPLCARLVPHALVVSRLVGERSIEPAALAELLDRVGTYLQTRGELRSSRPLKDRALAITELALGPNHPDVAHNLNNLAVLLLEQGEVGAARSLDERALAIRERALGPDEPELAASLNEVGMVRREQGDLAGARPLLERALSIRERMQPPDRGRLGLSLNNLGLLLGELGEAEAARPLLERALAINEELLGPDHPHTAITLGNLGNLLRDRGELAGAERLLERALAISERALGPDHPQTANGLDNLALLRWRWRNLGAARSLLERGLSVRERRLGPDHPRTARSLHWLGRLLTEQGDSAGIVLLGRALATYERALGRDHPTTVECRRALTDRHDRPKP
jgi:tetratricopeptide (TPR) repeat protein